MTLRVFKILSGLLLISATAFAQGSLPFWKDVQNFKKADSALFPAPDQVLLIGSSSFTLWKDVQDYFPKSKILNRAFGGSTLLDQMCYRYDVIFPYAPKQIILYCGENDFASSDAPSVDEVVKRFVTLYTYIRSKYSATPFVYVSMKPSPSRKHLFDKYKEANTRIKQFLSLKKYSQFVDVFSLMLNSDGSIMSDIFLQDNLHMNAKGYAIWQKALLPHLN